MASETKRQNAGNKAPVALPNSGPPPSPTVSLETALGGVMGARVRVTTSPPTSATYEGLLYTADPITNLIVLSISPSPSSTSATAIAASSSTTTPANSAPTNTFKLLPIPLLTSFTILSLPTSTTTSQTHTPSLPTLVALDIPSLTARTASTISTLKTQDAKRGRGVTREAQDIFDGISRTYPARWAGTAMVVNENVVIEQPYLVEDCRLLSPKGPDGGEEGGSSGGVAGGGKGGSAEQGLLRIKKVLGMEREKLALRRGLGTGGFGLGVGKIRGGGVGASAGAGVGLGERKGG